MHRAQVDELFARYREPLFRFLRRFLRDGTVAEDLTQESFLRALNGSYRASGQERAWIFQIARNLARDHLRVRARQPPLTDVDSASAGVTSDGTLAMELEAALATLAHDDREVFLLREVAGLSYAEIAAASSRVRWRRERTASGLRPLEWTYSVEIVYRVYMRKAISITLSEDNLLWLKGQAARTSKGSVSEVLDGIVRQARTSGGGNPEAVKSVAGTIDIPDDDPHLATADAYLRSLFATSARRPILVRERPARDKARKARRG